ncbi:hypothetical protein [Legionella jordanis]|uniref:Uncharacterized protein n=1 Tax=Legionella jordanis TaxID=456 RepID=A0A0W0VCD4_9GAMM|nr:hypothetical protein [Legionella jordanis]KTD17770.1 hypothetical protein Ljor_2076 [Legionella jordanis]VEH11294.1 Uncharacterised protein [Legionella jordanis]HAT8713739.1 hypothetical protein [Legionella jordanis]
MPGKIHSIWFTQASGKLHPAIVPNLLSWSKNISNDFSIELWTNLNELLPSEIESLKLNNIIIRDHSACNPSPLYPYFLFFFEKGLQGDKAAFALASDVLRMCILGLTPDDEFFIYVDANDTAFLDLKKNLQNLDAFTQRSNLGYSFQAVAHPEERMVYTRNDVLIALRKIKPAFFNDYLKYYEQHLEQYHKDYVVPKTNSQAVELARNLTNSTERSFFRFIEKNDQELVAFTTFANHLDYVASINCMGFFPYVRLESSANTWLPYTEQNGMAFFAPRYPTPSQKTPKKNVNKLFQIPDESPSALIMDAHEKALEEFFQIAGVQPERFYIHNVNIPIWFSSSKDAISFLNALKQHVESKGLSLDWDMVRVNESKVDILGRENRTVVLNLSDEIRTDISLNA